MFGSFGSFELFELFELFEFVRVWAAFAGILCSRCVVSFGAAGRRGVGSERLRDVPDGFIRSLSLPGDDVAPVAAPHFGGPFGVGQQGAPDGDEVEFARLHELEQ